MSTAEEFPGGLTGSWRGTAFVIGLLVAVLAPSLNLIISELLQENSMAVLDHPALPRGYAVDISKTLTSEDDVRIPESVVVDMSEPAVRFFIVGTKDGRWFSHADVVALRDALRVYREYMDDQTLQPPVGSREARRLAREHDAATLQEALSLKGGT